MSSQGQLHELVPVGGAREFPSWSCLALAYHGRYIGRLRNPSPVPERDSPADIDVRLNLIFKTIL